RRKRRRAGDAADESERPGPAPGLFHARICDWPRRRGTYSEQVMQLNLKQKLAILADAAKYDASCASSGTEKRDSLKGGIGSTEGSGICHSYAPDGRCISLLKLLLTNFCIYDCAYCINRSSSNVERARFTPE